MIGSVKPGSKTALQVYRRGGHRELAVTVAEFEPERTRRTSERESAKPPAAVGTLGVGVVDLTDAQKRDLKLKNGVRVESRRRRGRARRAA